MTRGSSPWGDPAVETGFQAAYEPYAPAQERRTLPTGPTTVEDDRAEAADVAARPLLPDGRRARAAQPGRLSPGRAAAGAAVSVAGVALGIATLLWISDDPSEGPGPVVAAEPAAADDVVLDPFASRPEGETAPVDPPPVPAAVVAPTPSSEPVAAPSVVVPVTVLNNSRIAGLADRGASRFERAGWPVADTGNYRGRIRATTVYYPPGLEAAAREFARRFAGIERVLPRPDNLPGSGLTVVLTRDFAS